MHRASEAKALADVRETANRGNDVFHAFLVHLLLILFVVAVVCLLVVRAVFAIVGVALDDIADGVVIVVAFIAPVQLWNRRRRLQYGDGLLERGVVFHCSPSLTS